MDDDEDNMETNCQRRICVANEQRLHRIKMMMESWTKSTTQEKCEQLKFLDELSVVMSGYENCSEVLIEEKSSSKAFKDQAQIMMPKGSFASSKSEGWRRMKKIQKKSLKQKARTNNEQMERNSTKCGKGVSSSFSARYQIKQKLFKKLQVYKNKLREQKKSQRILIEKIMSNHITARLIFQFLPMKDLLSCSLVNKIWNSHARLVLRSNRECLARIVSISSSCRTLKTFNLIVEKSVNIPFNGLSICSLSLTGRSCCHWMTEDQRSNMDLDNCDDLATFCSFLVNPSMTIKYLKIRSFQISTKCPVFHILRRILTDYSQHLIKVYIGGVTFRGFPQQGLNQNQTIHLLMNTTETDQSSTTNSVQKLPIVTKLSNLKYLYIFGTAGPYYSRRFDGVIEENITNQCGQVVADFITCSPNLEKIDGIITPDIIPAIMSADKAHTIKNFKFTPSKPEHLAQTSLFAMSKSQLTFNSMTVLTFDVSTTAPFNSILATSQSLYASCGDSLQSLSVGHFDFLMFIDQIMPPLPLLVELRLTFHIKLNDLLVIPSLTRIDYLHKFPSLKAVIVDIDPLRSTRRRDRFIQEFRSRWANIPQHSPATFVDKLCLNFSYYACPVMDTLEIDRTMETFSTIFTHLTHIYFGFISELAHLLPHLWKSWIHLETITFNSIRDTDVYRNIDWAFTGMSQEDCQKLRDTGNYENFQSLQVETSIANLKKLKLLRMRLNHYEVKCKYDDKDEDLMNDTMAGENKTRSVFISQVTRKCSFDMMPGLKVEIFRQKCDGRPKGRSCLFSLDCLLPTVEIIDGPLSQVDNWKLRMTGGDEVDYP